MGTAVSSESDETGQHTKSVEPAMVSTQKSGKLNAPARTPPSNVRRKHQSQGLRRNIYEIGPSEELEPVRDRPINHLGLPQISPKHNRARQGRALAGSAESLPKSELSEDRQRHSSQASHGEEATSLPLEEPEIAPRRRGRPPKKSRSRKSAARLTQQHDETDVHESIKPTNNATADDRDHDNNEDTHATIDKSRRSTMNAPEPVKSAERDEHEAVLNQETDAPGIAEHERDERATKDTNPAVDQIRLSEVGFGDAGHSPRAEQSSNPVAREFIPPLRKLKKRKAADQVERPAKVSKPNEQNEETTMLDPIDDDSDAADEVRGAERPDQREQAHEGGLNDSSELQDLWKSLREISASCKSVRKGIRNFNVKKQRDLRIRFESNLVNALKELQKKCLEKLQSAKAQPEVHQSFEGEVAEINDVLEPLWLDPGIRNAKTCETIYASVIPRLVFIMKDISFAYMLINKRSTSESTAMSNDHLKVIRTSMAIAVRIGEAAMSDYPRSRELKQAKVLLRMNNEVIRPLQRINRDINDHVDAGERATQREEARNTRQRRWAEDRSRRDREELEEAHFQLVVEAWKQLHHERREVMMDFYLSLRQQKHFAYVHPTQLEYDHNGQPYERVQVFADRPPSCPSLTQIQRARVRPWSPQQQDALRDGLRQYAGQGVFRDIFRRYCHKRAVLFEFNVTEIVVKAADLKDVWERQLHDVDEAVPEWVKQIPSWTRPQAFGKENDREHENANDVDEQ